MDQKRLKELLHYCPDTGVFTRRSTGKPTGTFKHHKYVRVHIDAGRYYAHRLAWLYVYGEWPLLHLDHINHDPLDNRIANLRQVTVSQNVQNSRVSKANTSGQRGVSLDRRRGRWCAYIFLNRRKHHIGCYDTFEAAAQAYIEAAPMYHTHNPTAHV